MATIGGSVLTKVDFDKRLDPDGKIADIADVLTQSLPILKHIPWMPSNQPTSHLSVVRTSRGAASWRRFNQGVAPTKGTTRQNTDGIGMLEKFTEVDCDLAKLNGNEREFRLSEAESDLEAMAEEFAGTLMYGNAGTAQEEFNGFATRYADPAGDLADNIIDAGGSSTGCTSIFLVGWKPNKIWCAYPKGSAAGLVHEDLGKTPVSDATGAGAAKYMAYLDHYQWKGGLVVKDPRWAVRIGSIKVSTLTADVAGSTYNLCDLMIRAMHRLPNLDSDVNLQWYVPRTVGTLLDIQLSRKSNVHLTMGNEEGKDKLLFRGKPVNILDAISENETAI